MHDYLTCSTGFEDALGSQYSTVAHARVMQSSEYFRIWLHMPQ